MKKTDRTYQYSKEPRQSDRPDLQLIAWEMTRQCNLECTHCRAAARRGYDPGELPTAQCLDILDQISRIGKPVIILTGGEPLLRHDLFEIAEYGKRLDLRMVMATNGTLLTKEHARKIKSTGIQRISVSLDGATPEAHDQFRNVPGAFQAALRGIRLLRQEEIAFQINTTVTRHNVRQVEDILQIAIHEGAVAHHIFLLVPTGRGRDLQDQTMHAEEYENLLHWFYQKSREVPIHLKATCAPHYYRVLRQEARQRKEKVEAVRRGLEATTRGCLAGTAFCFIAYNGIVQPCGYLELASGDLKQISFAEVWDHSDLFTKLRTPTLYKGKCGRCEYLNLCGGCRARAYAQSGDFLDEEPLCIYQPQQ